MPTRRRLPLLLLCLALTTTLIAACTPSTQSESTRPAPAAASSEQPESPTANGQEQTTSSILTVDVCAWVGRDTAGQNLFVARDTAQEVRWRDGVTSIRCPLTATGEDGEVEVVGAVTLVDGGAGLDDWTGDAKPYEHAGFHGIEIVVPSLITPRAAIVVDLHDGVVVSVDAEADDPPEMTFAYNLRRLTNNIVDAWSQDLVPVTDGSILDPRLCDQVTTDAVSEFLGDGELVHFSYGFPGPDVTSPAAPAPTDDGRGRFACGVAANTDGGRQPESPWSSPLGPGLDALDDPLTENTITASFFRFADEAAAAEFVESTSVPDAANTIENCTKPRRVGAPAATCMGDSGAGTTRRQDVSGTWVIRATMSLYATPMEQVAGIEAAALEPLDAMVTGLVGKPQSLQVADAPPRDPRIPEAVRSTDALVTDGCDGAGAVYVKKTKNGSVGYCPTNAGPRYMGEFHGVPFETVPGTTCAEIDTTSWDPSPYRSGICVDDLTLTVYNNDASPREILVREYFTELLTGPSGGS